MKEIKYERRGSFSGWWLVAALVLLIVAMSWEAEARNYTPPQWAAEIERLRSQDRLDSRWLVEFYPWGLGHWSMVVGTGSESLQDCIAKGREFLGLTQGVGHDWSQAVFLCQRECVLLQDNSGERQCLDMQLYNVSGQRLVPAQ